MKREDNRRNKDTRTLPANAYDHSIPMRAAIPGTDWYEHLALANIRQAER